MQKEFFILKIVLPMKKIFRKLIIPTIISFSSISGPTVFNSGNHSFYGAFQLTVCDGSPNIFGAELPKGFQGVFFAPVYKNPLVIESS